MTKPTPHGQVPEALIDLIDAYAETRHRYGRIYNARTEAARKAVIEALSGVQALSAAPAMPAGWKAVPVNPTPEMWKAAKSVPDPNPPYPPHYGLVWDAMLAASPTPPAEQQAAPKAAPGEQDDHQILAITTAYEQGVGKGHQAYNSGKEIANPYSPAYRRDLAWQYGYKEGKEQAQREAKAAPQQEAQEPDHSLRTDALCQLAYCNGMKAGWNYCVDGNEVDFARAMEGVSEAMKVLRELRENAPQPAPAPLSDDAVKDAARYRWLIDQHWIQTEVDWRLMSTDQDSTIKQLDAAIDAAIAAQGGKV